MQLLQETPELHESPTLHPFRSQFKRHTEFSMIDIQQNIVNNTVEFSKYGDVLMYSYLYSDYLLVDSSFTWSSYISTIDFYIGEQLVNSYDIDYIVNIYPQFIVETYSHSVYSQNSFFLPIPIPRIPMCSLRYTKVKLVVNFIKRLPNYKCFSMYSLVSDEDKKFLISNPHDIIIHQTQSKSINTDGSIILNHPIKLIYSDNISTDKYVLNGTIFDIPNTQIYYTCRFFKNQFQQSSSIKLLKTPINLPNSVTSTVVGKLIYIFPETGNYYLIFNSVNETFTQKTIGQTLQFTYSVLDSGVVLACGERSICVINPSTGTDIISTFSVNLIGVFYATIISGKVYAFGKRIFNSCLLNGTLDLSGRVYNNTETNFAYATKSGNLITFYTTDGKFKTNTYNVTIDTPLSVFNLVNPIVETQFKYVSSAIQINNLVYYTPMSPTDNLLITLNDEILQSINIGYGISSGVFNDAKSVYLCPIGAVSEILKFDIVSVLSLALFFCLNSNSQNPSGSLNFSRVDSFSFPGIYSGTLNAVNYNILRIENGFGSILYAS